MIKSSQGSSARIVAAILCSMVVILLVLYIRQTNQYSTLLRIHHQSQNSMQEKTIDIAKLKNELKVKDSQCTAELETLDNEATECDIKSQALDKELENIKKKVSAAQDDKASYDSIIAAEKERFLHMQQQLQKEAETCVVEGKELETKLKECEASKALPPPNPVAPKINDLNPMEIAPEMKQEGLTDENTESVQITP
ncbi:hypothetical protein LOD99_1321 [Oopsacas minuta]|uniref:Uncharacterized protein n=1 Tax=Oopsacas minuta TaxID=111878 RepID=A0AAV7K6L4_9METZ|nr:hypothetical protein LOD99_1321 [Oopsacas minuta]